MARDDDPATNLGRAGLLDVWPAGRPLRLPEGQAACGLPQLEGIAWDSRAVRPNDIFVALVGAHVDGHEHLREAANRGAVAALVQESLTAPLPTVVVTDTRRTLSALSAELFGHPTRSLHLVGVTGTDGKTTTTHLTRSLLAATGTASAAMSTVHLVGIDGRSQPNRTRMTTPEAPLLHRFLAEQLRAGAAAAVVESTSHALVQDRLADCRFSAAVVTNLAPEHLDFHGSFDAYAAAKLRILDLLDPAGTLLTHHHDQELERFRRAWRGRALTFGIGAGDIRADDLQEDGRSCRFTLSHGRRSARVTLPLAGRHNVCNALGAAAVLLGDGADLGRLAEALSAAEAVPGRLQVVEHGQPFRTVVDFAHTPQALEAVTSTLRPTTPGRLIVVFGSAGGRPAELRRAMGRAVSTRADVAVITADDPRDEDPAEIAEQIRGGIPGAGGPRVRVVEDRRAAIREALDWAVRGDTVLIAGKGGQTTMHLSGGRVVPWDDVAEVEAVLAGDGF
ncbi:MAG: UDP-N-acetylmuramoyl-L-alanyl-D-glutamate--2,6-diaminopimelate ligase [Candidatus Dormibacteria bacterium]